MQHTHRVLWKEILRFEKGYNLFLSGVEHKREITFYAKPIPHFDEKQPFEVSKTIGSIEQLLCPWWTKNISIKVPCKATNKKTCSSVPVSQAHWSSALELMNRNLWGLAALNTLVWLLIKWIQPSTSLFVTRVVKITIQNISFNNCT